VKYRVGVVYSNAHASATVFTVPVVRIIGAVRAVALPAASVIQEKRERHVFTNILQGFVIVTFVPCAGTPATYNVCAFVTVTDEFVAAIV